MAATYVHLSGIDTDNVFLKLYGLAKDEKKEEDTLKIKVCPKCQKMNDPISRFCKRCASPLNIGIALEVEEKIKEKDEVVAQVIEKIIRELNLEKRVYKTIKEMRLEDKFRKS